MKKEILITILTGLMVTTLVWAWSEPTVPPPGGNVFAPLNTGTGAQGKSGGLILNTGGASNGLIVANGNVGIGTVAPGYKVDVNGAVRATAYWYSSDINLKNNIKILDNSLEKILKLDGISFNWKDTQKPSIGLISQDVEKIFPEIVSTSKTTGLKSIEYAKLVAPLIEAIKEQQKEINLLKEEINKLK